MQQFFTAKSFRKEVLRVQQRESLRSRKFALLDMMRETDCLLSLLTQFDDKAEKFPSEKLENTNSNLLTPSKLRV